MSSALELLPLPTSPTPSRNAATAPAQSDRSQATFDDRLAEANSRQSARERSADAAVNDSSIKDTAAARDADTTTVQETDESSEAIESADAKDATDRAEEHRAEVAASPEESIDGDEVIEPEVRLDYELTFETEDGQAVVAGTLLLDPENLNQALATPATVLGDLSQATGAVNVSLTQTALPGSQPTTPTTPTPTDGQALQTGQAVVTPEASVFDQSTGNEGEQANNPSDPNAAKTAAADGRPAGTATTTPTFTLPLPGAESPNASPRVDAATTAALNPSVTVEQLDGDDAINAARITRGLNNAVSQNGGAVTLRLTPPEMGTVRIQLQMQGANVSAQFHAETESARNLLTQQLHQLRSSLESAGLSVDKIGVQTMNSTNSSQLQQQQSDQQQQQAQDHSDGRSRGRFGQRQNQGQQQNPDGGQQRNPRFRSVFEDSNNL